MQSRRLATIAGLVSAILVASPVSATARFSSATCTISGSNTVASVVLKGLDWAAGAPHVLVSNNRQSFGNEQTMTGGASGYSYTYTGYAYKYVMFQHALAAGGTKQIIKGCR